MIRFNHETNSWQQFICYDHYSEQSKWCNISAEHARALIDNGYKVEI